MKVKIQVEFEVSADGDGDDALTMQYATNAAIEAAIQHLAFTRTGFDVSDSVYVHAEGFGECAVKIGEDHG